jgi:hypothetical protein
MTVKTQHETGFVWQDMVQKDLNMVPKELGLKDEEEFFD